MGVENGDMMRYAPEASVVDWRKLWLKNTEEPEIESDGSWCTFDLGGVRIIREGNPDDEAELALCTQEAAGHLDPNNGAETPDWHIDDLPDGTKIEAVPPIQY